MQKINNWLEDPNRDFTEGVKLYQEFGQNPTLKHSFLKGESVLKMSVLAYELGKMVDMEAVEQVKPVEKVLPLPKTDTPTVQKIVDVLAKELGSFPKELIDLIQKRGHLSNKKAIVHNKMLDLPNHATAERAMAMAEMAAIRKEIEDITDIEKHYTATGKMPEPKAEDTPKKDILSAPIPTDKAELLILKKQLTEMKSKANKKLKTQPNGTAKVALETKIDRINEKQKHVETALQSS